MSAIWGTISRNGKNMPETAKAMEQSVSKYAIDRIERVSGTDYYFACGHQHITAEAKQDISPVFDEHRSLVFTADCYLFNRDEIVDTLKAAGCRLPDLKIHNPAACGDAYLLYLMYCIYGVEFVHHVKGSFSCAIYVIKEQKLLLFADHVGTRYLAYSTSGDSITFGTTYGAIHACCPETKKVNREFIIREFIDMSPLTFTLPDLTVYEGIYHVNIASYVEIDCRTKKIKKFIYWDPIKNVKKIKGKSDEECRDLFIQTYRRVARGYLRSCKKTAIALSGGLDSSSIAAIFAPMLAEKNENLYSFTMVPAEDYICQTADMRNENETEMIKEQQKWHPNLISQYVNGNTGNCFSHVDEWQLLFESPVRPMLNMTGISAMYAAASKSDCNIMLVGSGGNSSITYGNIFEYFSITAQSGHPLRACRELTEYCRAWRLSRKTFARLHLSALVRYFLPKKITANCFLYSRDVKAYSLKKVEKQALRRFGNRMFTTKRCKENELMNKTQLQHLGYYNTYKSLIYGVFSLDITCDAEIIELCQALPMECFVKGSQERRLVRGYMKGMIPDIILDPTQNRGLQAADYAHRVNRDWESIRRNVYEWLENPLLDEYLNREEINKLIEEIKASESNLNKQQIRNAVLCCSLSSFLNQYSS